MIKNDEDTRHAETTIELHDGRQMTITLDLTKSPLPRSRPRYQWKLSLSALGDLPATAFTSNPKHAVEDRIPRGLLRFVNQQGLSVPSHSRKHPVISADWNLIVQTMNTLVSLSLVQEEQNG